MRQTPYLKLYLLRCDDNETYKSTSRKAVREWIKTHASPPQSGSSGGQDNHDAFEYLIIHIIPPTAAAEVAEKAGPMAKWSGRGSTSVLEKVKADFNGTSKSAIDRVVQIRVPRPETPQKPPELSTQLSDLVTKLKSGILASFDLRVSQYEEDIREKDSQRSLPGWNFCTFFVLKEGLARGFEHVGLYEDALVGYDELSVGLDAALRDQLVGLGDQHGGTFLSYTEDIKAKVESTLASLSQETDKSDSEGDESVSDSKADDESNKSTSCPAVELDPQQFPLDARKKPYRDMILANNISIFDFRAYIFSRQMLLLLKAAGAPFLRQKSSTDHQTTGPRIRQTEDLTLLAEVCERASEFISTGARTLRHDLELGIQEIEYDRDEQIVTDIVNNTISSWAYATVSQVLIQTATDALDLPKASLLNNHDIADPSVLASLVAETRTGTVKRSSSLLVAPAPNSRPTSQEIFASDTHANAAIKNPFSSLNQESQENQKTGAAELASIRGDLFLFSRRTLEKIGRSRGWLTSWRELSLLYDETENSSAVMKEVSLDNDNTHPVPLTRKDVTTSLTGLDTPNLISAGKSQKRFNLLFENLTDLIFRHYVSANRARSAEMAMADIAILKFRMGDYSFAASYFHQLIPFYANTHWDILEGAMLELYGRCLKNLGRKDEYVRVTLRLLGQYAKGIHAGFLLRSQPSKRLSSAAPSSFSMESKAIISEYLDDLFGSSRELSRKITTPLRDFFGSVDVNPTIIHFNDKDGFQLRLRLRYLLGSDINIDEAKIRLVNVSDPYSVIWLQNSQDIVVKSSNTTILLSSYVSIAGF